MRSPASDMATQLMAPAWGRLPGDGSTCMRARSGPPLSMAVAPDDDAVLCVLCVVPLMPSTPRADPGAGLWSMVLVKASEPWLVWEALGDGTGRSPEGNTPWGVDAPDRFELLLSLLELLVELPRPRRVWKPSPPTPSHT